MTQMVFRADASVALGTGHVMRCLALADALQRRAVTCHFICREQTGHLIELVRQHGHMVHGLPAADSVAEANDWQADCKRVAPIVRQLRPDWLIVDHYQLGNEWENRIRPSVGRLLAIDDLGRLHCCDLLLDQNVANPVHARYEASRGAGAELLLGPRFALLRPEFAHLRPQALRRRDGALRRLLVTMGGSDPVDETSKVLNGLQQVRGRDWSVDVVVGSTNPNRKSVEAACARLPAVQMHVDTARMAELMMRADCAVGAGGSTTWERCCLGLPALVTVLSSDQVTVAESLAAMGVHVNMGWSTNVSSEHYARALGELAAERLQAMAAAAAGICDGLGAERVAESLQLRGSVCARS
jgi:UDP-2,4-diacetamido-2,4,6-trideoxy-beta-L-altropyranose hydrolase